MASTYHTTGERKKQGRIEVVCGSMFSGKTEKLIRRLKRAIFAKQKVVIFKPSIDTRYSEADVVSHDHNSISSTPVSSPKSILKLAQNFDVVGIDEAQFFDKGLTKVCDQLANQGIRVIVAGLDGLPRRTIRTDTRPLCHSRRSDQGSRHLCEMWCIGLLEPSLDSQ